MSAHVACLCVHPWWCSLEWSRSQASDVCATLGGWGEMMDLAIGLDDQWLARVEAALARMRTVFAIMDGNVGDTCGAVEVAVRQAAAFHSLDFMSGLATVLVDPRMFKPSVVDAVYRVVANKHYNAREIDPIHVTNIHFQDVLIAKAVAANNIDALAWLHECTAVGGMWTH